MASHPTILNKRYSSLDLLRGIGIWMIVLYHVYKNIFTPNPYASLIYRSLYFTTGYFVFSVGLVLAIHYFPKIVAESSTKLIYFRIFVRSLKLILIVVVANIVFLSLSGNDSTSSISNGLEKIITLLYADRWDVSYQVLLPISVTLEVGYFLIVLLRRFPRTSSYGSLLLVLAASILYPNSSPYLWRFTAYGLIGVVCGYYYIRYMHNNSIRYLSLLCGALSITFISISFCDIYWDYNYYIFNNLPIGIISSSFYTISLFLLLENILHFKITDKQNSFIFHYFTHIGRNSLFYYIFQGFFCIVIAKIFNTSSDYTAIGVSFAVLSSCSLVYLVIKFFRTLRMVDVAYKFIFQ